MQGGGGYFLKIPYPLLEGTFWKKGIFRADTHPPTAKSTLVLFYFRHKNCFNTPPPPLSSAQSATIFGVLETHFEYSAYFCLKCPYFLDLFNFKGSNCLAWLKMLGSSRVFTRDTPIFIVKSSKRYKNAYFSLRKVPWVLFEFYNFEGQTPHPPPHPTPG